MSLQTVGRRLFLAAPIFPCDAFRCMQLAWRHNSLFIAWCVFHSVDTSENRFQKSLELAVEGQHMKAQALIGSCVFLESQLMS